MLSLGWTSVPHAGHRERGATIDCFRGTRWTRTVTKLPMTSPSRTAKTVRAAVSKAGEV